ncbi:hypothetical protein GGR88_000139 [Sphingomonas jejuensis]|uniref:SPOR domain-containing protein n=1 Tax=Sphingomonas jejuensis TaxID=904715 RepID=A0ABX0XHG8_9SPHN|nr:SPOR domain-containing protein [Sphingomonas jejuensis]NJC32665.1 hypothetical protein [Sphingomonas jejuensis]
MTSHQGDLLLSDEDRLPWLEPASPERARDPRGALRWVVLGLGALLLLGLLIAGGLWLTRGGDATDGGGALIRAPQGPYKVRPADPGGMEVEGRGDASFAASEGETINGAIDLAAQPEAPVEGQVVTQAAPPPPPPAASASRSASAAIPQSGGRLTAAAPGTSARVAQPSTGGSLVQLGSFNSERRAREAWTILSGRFTVLADRTPQVATGEVAGRDVYRLRLDAGSPAAARELCQRLRVGGEACLVIGG